MTARGQAPPAQDRADGSFIDRWIPDSIHALGEDAPWKARLTIIGSLVFGALLLMLLVTSAFLEVSPAFTALAAAGALATLSAPWLLRVTGSVPIAAATIPLTLLAVDGGIAYTQDGIISILVGFNGVIPLLAVFLVGARFGLVCALLVCAEVVLFQFTDLWQGGRGALVAPPPDGAWVPECVQAFAGWMLGLLYERLRRRALDRAERARAQAERANVAKDDFLATVSHEIRTPMNGVLGMTELVLDSELSSDQRRSLGIVQSSARSLLGLVGDLLDVSRIEAGTLKLAHEPFDLKRLARDVLALLEPQALGRSLELRLAWELGRRRRFLGDAARVRQVLINLLSNALKFTFEGGVTLRILSEPSSGDVATIRAQVEDSGRGIPTDKLRDVFEPFRQVKDADARAIGGVGLGLSITRTIVAGMGGTIEVDSEVGRGTTFAVTLPLGVVEQDALEPRDPSASSSADAARVVVPGLRVLVADDDALNRFVLERMLRRLEAKAEFATDGQEVLERLQQDEERVDVILMDGQMPRMDGLEATRRIRRDNEPWIREIPIFGCTAGVLREELQRCLEAGMDGVMTKPLENAALVTSLSRLQRDAHGALRLAPE